MSRRNRLHFTDPNYVAPPQNPYQSWRWWLAGGVIAAGFLVGIHLVGYHTVEIHTNCTVEAKDLPTLSVHTSCGSFQVDDDWGRGIYHAELRFAELEEGQRYNLETAGWAYRDNMYPNIIKAALVREEGN